MREGGREWLGIKRRGWGVKEGREGVRRDGKRK